MQLPLLFETQAKLDNHIVELKGLESENLIYNRLLAFQVELGELINEWRRFKFWSNNQEPNTSETCGVCDDAGVITAKRHDSSEPIDVVCPACNGVKSDKNPLLEEYVDCLHFLLSIGNTLGYRNIIVDSDYTEETTIKTFIYLNGKITALTVDLDVNNNKRHIYNNYEELFGMFVGLGEKHLGFKWSDVVDAYFKKNKVNYERQKVGY